MPGLIKIIAKNVSPPPQWALLEHKLIKLMEKSVPLMVDKYAENGGAFYFADDLDDLYELTYNWSLFYSMGADKQVFNLALQQWNATTRFFSDDIVSRKHSRFRPQIHNEYYNLATPAEWHHKGEGNMAFYHFGLADPSISENVRRSKRYAAMYMGDDPEAPNYDNKHKIFRCPLQTSQGPINNNNVTVEMAVEMEPEDTDLRVSLAMAYERAGQAVAALSELEVAVELDPQLAQAHYLMGTLYERAGRDQEALDRYRAAITYDPSSPEAQLLFANTLRRLGFVEASLAPYRQVLELDADTDEAQFGEALALVWLGRHREARARLEEATSRQPGHPAFATALARLLAASPDAQVRNGRRAFELIEVVVENYKTTAVAETMAMALAELGEFRGAAEWQQLAIDVARDAGQSALAQEMSANLGLYQRGEPCRTPWRDDEPEHRPGLGAEPGLLDVWPPL